MLTNICVSIAEKTYNDVVSALSLCNFAEIRLDLSEINDKEIRLIFGTPDKRLIATCRQGIYTESERISRLNAAMEAGAAYVDIEVEESDVYRQTLSQKAQATGCKVIISHHDFDKTPPLHNLEHIVSNCERLGADVVKLVTTAHTPTDAATVLSLYVQYANLVAFAMGDAGKITRLACLYLGAPFTYASISDNKAVANGQLSISNLSQLTNLLSEQ